MNPSATPAPAPVTSVSSSGPPHRSPQRPHRRAGSTRRARHRPAPARRAQRGDRRRARRGAAWGRGSRRGVRRERVREARRFHPARRTRGAGDPVLLTSTLSAFRVADALVGWVLEQPDCEGVLSLNPVVGSATTGICPTSGATCMRSMCGPRSTQRRTGRWPRVCRGRDRHRRPRVQGGHRDVLPHTGSGRPPLHRRSPGAGQLRRHPARPRAHPRRRRTGLRDRLLHDRRRHGRPARRPAAHPRRPPGRLRPRPHRRGLQPRQR